MSSNINYEDTILSKILRSSVVYYDGLKIKDRLDRVYLPKDFDHSALHSGKVKIVQEDVESQTIYIESI